MSNIQYNLPGDEKHRKRNGSVYQSGSKLTLQHRRVNPLQKRTAPQQNIRSVVLYVSRMWKDLTPTEQGTWTPCPGESLTGYQLYMSINLTGMEAGNPLERSHICPHTKLFEQPYFVNEFE